MVASCSPVKRLTRIYDNHPELRPISTIDTLVVTYDTIIYRDTVVYVTIAADTIDNEIPVVISPPGKPWEWTKDTLVMNSLRSTSKTWIVGGLLRGMLIDKQLDLEFRFDSVIKEATYWKELYVNAITVVPEYYCAKWKEVFSIIGIVLSMVMLLLGVYLVKKRGFN